MESARPEPQQWYIKTKPQDDLEDGLLFEEELDKMDLEHQEHRLSKFDYCRILVNLSFFGLGYGLFIFIVYYIFLLLNYILS